MTICSMISDQLGYQRMEHKAKYPTLLQNLVKRLEYSIAEVQDQGVRLEM